MSRTVLSDLLGFLVLVFCPCKLQSMIPGFSRASIPSQTVMPCNLTLTILSVGPNHLGSYLISPSVNTSVSPAKNHPYSPPILSTKRLWNLAIQRKTLVCGSQAILPRTNKWLNSVQKPTNSSALWAELLGQVHSKHPNASYTLSFYRPVPSRLRNLSMVATVHWLTKASWKRGAPCNKTNFEASLSLRCNLKTRLQLTNLLPISYWHEFSIKLLIT